MKIYLDVTNEATLIQPLNTNTIDIEIVEDLIDFYEIQKKNNVRLRGLIFKRITDSDDYCIEIYNDWRE